MRALQFAMDSGLFDYIHLSTDSDEIAEEGRRIGLYPEFMRSADTSHDKASSTEVLREVRDQLASIGILGQRFVILEPTSPMRKKVFVTQAINATYGEFDAAVTVSAVDVKYHPDKQFRLSESGELKFFTSHGPSIVARQQLTTTYIRNGFCYVVTDHALASGHDIFGSRCTAVVCDIDYVNIDTQSDLDRCRELLK